MALFTDAGVVTVNDLIGYEATISQVASSHGIDVDGKIGLAIDAIGDNLLLWLLSAGSADTQWLTRRAVGLSTVVVTAPLKRWIVFESLSRIYAEAYNVQLNTRFQAKWKEYQAESRNASSHYFLAGVGVVHHPLSKPGMPLVSVQSGLLPGQTIFVQTAWVDADGNESTLSPPNATVLPANSSFAVAMAEGALDAPAAAAGWNVYANNQPTGLTKQNSSPLAIGSVWQTPSSGMQVGANPTGGQIAAFYIVLSKQIRRG